MFITLLLVLHKPSNQKVAILLSYLLYNNSIITNALLLQYLYPYINYLPLRSSIRPGVRRAQAKKPSFGRFCHSPGQNCSLFVWIIQTLPQFVISYYRKPTSKIEKFLWESVWSVMDVLAHIIHGWRDFIPPSCSSPYGFDLAWRRL